MTRAPAYPELAAVVAGAPAEPPRKVKSAVLKLAEPRRCAPEVLMRLVDQAGDRLPPPGDDPGDPSRLPVRPDRRSGGASPPWWQPGTDFEALLPRLAESPRHDFMRDVDAFVRGLCHFVNVDYPAAPRRFQRPAGAWKGPSRIRRWRSCGAG